MTVTFRNYVHEEDYQRVSDFLIEDVLRDLTGLIMALVGHNIRVVADASRERVAEDLSGLMDGNGQVGV